MEKKIPNYLIQQNKTVSHQSELNLYLAHKRGDPSFNQQFS